MNAHTSRPRAAVGHMPFAGHRNQREVREDEEGPRLPPAVKTDADRQRDATIGSARLCEAVNCARTAVR